METIKSDLAKLTVSESQKHSSLLSMIGANADTSFDRNIVYEVVTDKYHISGGGDVIQPNATIQITIDDDSCIHYLEKYMICGIYVPTNGLCESASNLFEGTSLSIGNEITWSPANSRFYQAQKLSKMGKKKLEYHGKGLLMVTQDFIYKFADEAQLIEGTPLLTYVQSLQFGASKYQQQPNQYPFACSLSMVFPGLQSLRDNGALYTGMGRKIQFNLRTNPATSCQMGSIAGAALAVALLRCYSKLDSLRNDMILKSSFIFPKIEYIAYPLSTLTQSMNLIYGISQKDRLKGLIFAFHSTASPWVQTKAATSEENLISVGADTGLNQPYKYELGFFPQILLQNVQININGNPININQNTMQVMHLSSIIGDQHETYSNPTQRAMKWAYYIDLTRYGFDDDSFGSSSKSITAVSVQLQLKITASNRSISFQSADWDLTNLAQFSLQSFLEVQKMCELKNGVYREL